MSDEKKMAKDERELAGRAMENANETVREVCTEMNGCELDNPYLNRDGMIGARILARDWASRILAAHERELAAKDAEIARLKAGLSDYANLQKNITALRAEMTLKQSQVCEAGQRIRALNAALKPVIECVIMPYLQPESLNCHNALRAVNESQRIYKEGGEK